MTIESELARIGDLLEKLLAAEGSSKSVSTTTKTKRTKAPSESSQEVPATSSSTSVAPTTEAPPAAVEQEAPEAKPSTEDGTSPAPSSAVPSLDDVRMALTECQKRKGGTLDTPRAILSKYAKTGTLGSLAEADRAKVIAECNAS